MSYKTAKDNGFEIKTNPNRANLTGANGIKLTIMGVTTQKTSVRIKNTTKILDVEYHIIKNLPVPAIIGRKTLQRLQVCIKCNEDGDTLSYTDDDVEEAKAISDSTIVGTIQTNGDNQSNGPIIASTNVTVPKRTKQFINVMAPDVENFITRPSNNITGLCVANGLYVTKQSQCEILVMNTSLVPIQVRKGATIARYECLDGPNEPAIENSPTPSSPCHAIVKIDDSEATIEIGDELDENQANDIRDLVKQFKCIFSINGELGATELCEHDIVLIDGYKPVAEPLRRHALSEKDAVRAQIKSMLEKDVIEPSNSPWASAYVLVKKKNGQMRFCVDYRNVNAQTKRDVYPLPRLDDCLDFMANKVYFTLLDFASGYWQIPMAARAKEITAFRTTDGHWQCKKMPFGLTNSGASFQRMVDAVFSGLKNEELMVFIDDVCVASPSWDEHMLSLKQVFNRIKTARLRLQPPKCVIGATSIKFLGHRVSKHCIQPDESQISAIRLFCSTN